MMLSPKFTIVLGEASEKVAEAVGRKCRYNFKFCFQFPIGDMDENGKLNKMSFTDFGVIVDGGQKVFLKGMTIYRIEKLTMEQFEDMKNDYDPIEAPPGPFKIQPENQGM